MHGNSEWDDIVDVPLPDPGHILGQNWNCMVRLYSLRFGSESLEALIQSDLQSGLRPALVGLLHLSGDNLAEADLSHGESLPSLHRLCLSQGLTLLLEGPVVGALLMVSRVGSKARTPAGSLGGAGVRNGFAGGELCSGGLFSEGRALRGVLQGLEEGHVPTGNVALVASHCAVVANGRCPFFFWILGREWEREGETHERGEWGGKIRMDGMRKGLLKKARTAYRCSEGPVFYIITPPHDLQAVSVVEEGIYRCHGNRCTRATAFVLSFPCFLTT